MDARCTVVVASFIRNGGGHRSSIRISRIHLRVTASNRYEVLCKISTNPMPAPTQPTPRTKSDLLRFQTHHHLRQRLVLSVLSGKSIRVDGIRSDDVQVGLRDYEVNLLRLVEKVTNGSTIEISVTGALLCLAQQVAR